MIQHQHDAKEILRVPLLLLLTYPYEPMSGEGENVERWSVPPALEKAMIDVARQFRKQPTNSEALLWQRLRGKQLKGRKFRRQQPIGPFVVDFFCPSKRLIVEVDGPIHTSQQQADIQRQQLIESLGLRFVRVTSADVEHNLEVVLATISDNFHPQLPHHADSKTPSPVLGEGAGGEGPIATVLFRHLWGKTKRQQLLDTIDAHDNSQYEVANPPLGLGLPFMPARVEADYLAWPLLPQLFPTSFPGVKTSRDDVVVDIDRERLVHRMQQYFDPQISHDEMRRVAPGAMESTARFSAETTRDYLRKRGFLPDKIMRYCYRPFYLRWLYWEPETKLLDEKRAEYVPHVFEGNVWIESRQKQPMERFDRGYVVKVLSDNFGNGLSNYFPLYLMPAQNKSLFDFQASNEPQPNLSEAARSYLAALGANERDLFFHTIAVLHAPNFRAENAGALRQDWPRIPLPTTIEGLQASAALGRQIAALLDPETPVPGVTAGTLRPEIRTIGAITRVGGASLNPDTGDLELTAGWGHGGNGRVVMPAKGRTIQRSYTPEEQAALHDFAAPLGITTCDVYLNERVYWRNVPLNVWEYTIGGYQVIKKWLSYREKSVLGRSLTLDEVREVTSIARRIAAILMLEPQLDTNYATIKQNTYAATKSRSLA